MLRLNKETGSYEDVKLGGDAAGATSETMPRHIWIHHVELAASQSGITREFLNLEITRTRLSRYYTDGMPVWMAADAMVAFGRGYQRVDQSERDRQVLRELWKGS